MLQQQSRMLPALSFCQAGVFLSSGKRTFPTFLPLLMESIYTYGQRL